MRKPNAAHAGWASMRATASWWLSVLPALTLNTLLLGFLTFWLDVTHGMHLTPAVTLPLYVLAHAALVVFSPRPEGVLAGHAVGLLVGAALLYAGNPPPPPCDPGVFCERGPTIVLAIVVGLYALVPAGLVGDALGGLVRIWRRRLRRKQAA